MLIFGKIKRFTKSNKEKLFEDLVVSYENSIKKLRDLDDLNNLAVEENNITILKEVLINIKELLDIVKNEINVFYQKKLTLLIVILKFMQAQVVQESDWADMLRRMYLKWSDKKEFRSNLISEHKGEEAGIKSSTIKLKEIMFLDGLNREFTDL